MNLSEWVGQQRSAACVARSNLGIVTGTHRESNGLCCTSLTELGLSSSQNNPSAVPPALVPAPARHDFQILVRVLPNFRLKKERLFYRRRTTTKRDASRTRFSLSFFPFAFPFNSHHRVAFTRSIELSPVRVGRFRNIRSFRAVSSSESSSIQSMTFLPISSHVVVPKV